MSSFRSHTTRPPESDRRSRARTDPTTTSHHDAIFTLARASEIHDEDTGNHILRIRAIVQAIAEQMGFATADAEALGYDAMLHDVGKLTTPHTILKKPDHLTDDERRVMEAHTIRGETLLGERASMQRAARIARWHHESWDGTGYPDGLHGSEIPIEARITAAADLLDALISTRCYKQAWTYEDAFQEVIRLSGTKLDPTVVTAIELCNRSGVLCQIFGLAPRCAMG